MDHVRNKRAKITVEQAWGIQNSDLFLSEILQRARVAQQDIPHHILWGESQESDQERSGDLVLPRDFDIKNPGAPHISQDPPKD